MEDPLSAGAGEIIFTDPTSSGPTFRWDEEGEQYVYNWKTKGIVPGYWYRLRVKLDDGSTRSVVVGLK